MHTPPRRTLAVVALLLATSALHYLTPRGPEYHALHDVFRRFYYLPIVLGALWYGLRGGVLAALAATLLYLPHVMLQWGSGMHGHGSNQYLEIVMFNLLGPVIGLLAGREHRQRRALQRAYHRLEASFERGKQAERLAAVGRLAAELAHEIRHPVASLEGSLPILLEGVPDDDPRQEFAGICRQELARLESLTSQVLDYARPGHAEVVALDPNDILRRVHTALSPHARRRDIGLVLDLTTGLPPAPIDPQRMQQVFLNLGWNALEAAPDGGRVRLASGSDQRGSWLSVEDSGPGLDPAVREQLFEPFVTTKEGGTGLGLAVAWQLVQQQGGEIEAGDAPGGGARFVVRLAGAA